MCAGTGFFIDTWAPERFHKITKSVCEPVTNSVNYEKSCYCRLVATHVHELTEVPKDKLCGKVYAFQELAPGALMSCRLVTAENIQYCMDDVIFLDGAQLVMVLCAVSTAGYCQLLVELLDNVGQVRSKAWRCKRNLHDKYILDVRRHSVVHAACWTFENDERMLVLE